MRGAPGLVLLAGLLSCAPAPGTVGRFWTPEDFLRREAGLNFGGYPPAELGALPGERLVFTGAPFGPEVAAEQPGLQVLPAFAEGQVASYLVTDLWFGLAEPWLQPTYQPRDAQGRPATGPDGEALVGVFPVGERGSFYSPFWQAVTYVVAPGSAQLTSATAILSRHRELSFGPVVYCAIVPAGVTVAHAAGEPPRHPLTGEAVLELARLTAPAGTPGALEQKAFVDGNPVSYLAVGLDRVGAQGDALVEADMFVFSVPAADGGVPVRLPLPAILPDEPFRHALVERVDVRLPSGAAAFWPAQDAERVPALREAGVPLALEPDGGVVADPSLDAAAAAPYRLRVALNPSCFAADAGFPGSCRWLDSASAIRSRLGPSALSRPTLTYLAVVVLQVGGQR